MRLFQKEFKDKFIFVDAKKKIQIPGIVFL